MGTFKLTDKNMEEEQSKEEKIIKSFCVFQRIGHGHNKYIATIFAESAQMAFKNAVNDYFNLNLFDYYTEFYVFNFKEDGLEAGYGFSNNIHVHWMRINKNYAKYIKKNI